MIAARPCDAAALPILDHVFNWDFTDEFYNRRRAATTVITLACSASDEILLLHLRRPCPGRPARGSDAMLFDSRRRTLRSPLPHRKGPGAVLPARRKRRTESGKAAPAPEASSIPARFALSSTRTSRIPSGPSTRAPAWAAGSARSPVPPATASTSSTPGRRPATPASAPGTPASSRSLPCTLPATIRAAAQPARQRQRILHKFFNLPGKVRRNPLHRLRQLRTQLPGGPGRAEPADRDRTWTNIYKPDLMEVIAVRQQTVDVKSVSLRFLDPERAKTFSFQRRPVRHLLGVRIRRIDVQHLFQLELERPHRVLLPQGRPGHRSACGRSKSATSSASADRTATAIRGIVWKGHDLIFLGGGIAMPPIRCAVWYALENRADFGEITVVYGARTVGDLVYVDELEEWAKYERVRVVTCVDPGGETPDWKGEIGFVPTVFGAPGDHRRKTRRPGDRTADHDQEHAARAAEDGSQPGLGLYQPGEPHEMRRRQVRPLQRRLPLRLQRRPRAHHGAPPATAAGLLSGSNVDVSSTRTVGLKARLLLGLHLPQICLEQNPSQCGRGFRGGQSSSPIGVSREINDVIPSE